MLRGLYIRHVLESLGSFVLFAVLIGSAWVLVWRSVRKFERRLVIVSDYDNSLENDAEL
jgi:hypothetical protein